MTTSIRFNPIYFPVNRGHGDARRASLDACHNEWVALMDADDISLPNRFEKQLIAFSSNKTLDIVGGQIAEFIGTINNIIARRTVPENDGDIKSYAKKMPYESSFCHVQKNPMMLQGVILIGIVRKITIFGFG